jgi:hypothetical protein
VFCAPQQVMRLKCRNGSRAEELNVSISGPVFPSNPDIRADMPVGRVGPKPVVSNRSETPLYSITSSAVASSLSGTLRPSILAVSALMTSSNLVACTTGRSAGFAPLRMRPA